MLKRRGTGNCPIGFMLRATGCSFCAAQCGGALLKRGRNSGDRPPTCLLHLGPSSFEDHFLPRTPAAVGDDDPKWHAAAPIPSERNHLSLLLDPLLLLGSPVQHAVGEAVHLFDFFSGQRSRDRDISTCHTNNVSGFRAVPPKRCQTKLQVIPRCRVDFYFQSKNPPLSP